MDPGDGAMSATDPKQLQEDALRFLEECLLHFYEEKEFIVAKALISAKAALRDIRLADIVKLSAREVRRILETVLLPQYICDVVSSGSDIRYRIGPYSCAVMCYRVRLLTSKAKSSTDKAGDNCYVCKKCGKEFDEWRVFTAVESDTTLCCGVREVAMKEVVDTLDAKYTAALDRLSTKASGPLRQARIDWYFPEVEGKRKRAKPDQPQREGSDSKEDVDDANADGKGNAKSDEGESRAKKRKEHLEIPWLQEESKKLVMATTPEVSPCSVSHLASRRLADGDLESAPEFQEALQRLANNSSVRS
eukprot:GEMP01019234.1.p1 GENE.GEMP01019234.1~~GEMP01019234.1.p1  ORF type:complete len:305 (+),score=52.82 GEMP01019234.1:71-985(+)